MSQDLKQEKDLLLLPSDDEDEELIDYIENLSGVKKEKDEDLNTPLLQAAKNKDYNLVLKEIETIKKSGKDADTQLLYAFFSGPLAPPTHPTDAYGIAYAEIKNLAQEMILGGAFGSESEPRDPPLSKMEVDLLRNAEMSKVLGEKAQARAMAALSAGTLPAKPRKGGAEEFEIGDKVQNDYLTKPASERLGAKGVTQQIATDSLTGPVIVSSGKLVLSDGLPLAGYTLDKVIGKGVSGNVALGQDRGKKPVVIKKIRLDADKREESIDNVLRESALQMFISGQTKGGKIVCDLKEVIVSGEEAYVVLEACDGSLAGKLAKNPPTIDEAIGILADMAEMFGKMHDLGITHRDIKTDNILVKDDQMFISDFGLSKSHRTGKEQDKGKKSKSMEMESDVVLLEESELEDEEPSSSEDMAASLADDARKFALMILEQLDAMPDLTNSERQALPTFRNRFGSPQYATCQSYKPPTPNCLARCFGATDDPTRFSRLVNLLGELATKRDPKLMATCALKLRAILKEFET